MSAPISGSHLPVSLEEFPWVSGHTIRHTNQGEFLLVFPHECPVRLNFLRYTTDHYLTPGYHEFLELLLLCSGRGRLTVEHQCYPMAVGDLMLLGSHELHNFVGEPGQTVTVVAVHFHPEFIYSTGSSALDFEYLKPFFYRCATFSHRIERAALPEHFVLDRIGRMHREIQTGGAGYALAVKTYLTDILLETSRHYRKMDAEWVPRDRRMRDFDRLRDVLKFLRENCHEPVSLEQVSRIAHFSPNYFCRFFKALTGCTLTEYVLRLRVDLAADLLVRSEMSISQIAYATGFSSHSHLDRVFRRLKRMTPLMYRRQSIA